MDTDATLEIRPARKLPALFYTMALGLVLPAVVLPIIAFTDPRKGAGWIYLESPCLLLLTALLAWWFKRRARGGPVLFLSRAGIRYVRFSADTIPWSAVTALSSRRSRSMGFMTLAFDPGSARTFRLTRLYRANTALGASGLTIPVHFLDTTLDELLAAATAFRTAAFGVPTFQADETPTASIDPSGPVDSELTGDRSNHLEEMDTGAPSKTSARQRRWSRLRTRTLASVLVVAVASLAASFLAAKYGRSYTSPRERILLVKYAAGDILFLAIFLPAALIWLLLKVSGIGRALAVWSGLRIDDASPQVRRPVTDVYAWIAALVPIEGALIEHAIGYLAPDVVVSKNASFNAYVLAYLTFCFLDARQIKRSGTARDVFLFSWIWLPPAYLWQRTRALGAKPVFPMVWIAAWRISLFVFSQEVVNGVYVAGGVPRCGSTLTRDEVADVIDANLKKAHSDVTLSAVRAISELTGSAEGRTCKAGADFSDGQHLDFTFTITKHGTRIVFSLSPGARSGT